MSTWVEGDQARVQPWSDDVRESVETDLSELAAACGLPGRPRGRLWLLRIPLGANLESTPDEAVTPGASALTYDDGKYQYVWDTLKSWSGTCRQLTVRLDEGTDHSLIFELK
jgi:hypothetical protein